MIVNKNVNEYVVSVSSGLQDALRKINTNKHKVVYAVDEKNCLIGSLSDGDVRRWILAVPSLDLNVSLLEIIRQPCFSMSIDADKSSIENSFNERIISIPLVDKYGHLVAIAEPKADYFNIGKYRISNEDPVFIIAEIGNNHQGDINSAKRLVDLAKEAGADCVKFQMRNINKLYRNNGLSNDASADLGAQYTLDLLSRFQLNDKELFDVFDYCNNNNILALCTPWDLDSLNKLEEYGMPAYKVASADFTNYELLGALAKTGKPLICSTGMSTETEIQSTVAFLNRKNTHFILLHCNSTYPAPFKDINLNYLVRLKSTTGSLVGYSGHERGWAVPVAAISLGAKVIEKHFTIDRNLEGNDHKVSLLPDEFKQMVVQIRQVEESLGVGGARQITQGEMINREVLAKSLIINCDLSIGEKILREMIEVKSPGQGLQPNRIDELVGKIAKRNFKKGDYFYESDIKGGCQKKNKYSFNRPYGIPVRYHDYVALTKDMDMDFVEFHYSYKDLELNISKYISSPQDMSYAIHAPELFSGDHILDLAAFDDDYRKRSISELQNVINVARSLKKYFPKAGVPVVVVNVGGWDINNFLNDDLKNRKYDLVGDALKKINNEGVTIAIQTMPPFPWHFGGQSYHNLFVSHKEIKDFCDKFDAKICLDISHSMMACNYYSWRLEDFVETIAPYVVHMHVVDAVGVDGEGVQIGEGNVDFVKLGKQLDRLCPGVQFIPEVWQGHKENGAGFWGALEYLEKAWQ